MKLLLTILACLVAASAGAQTVKSLGYNTTNGNIVYSGTNDLRFPATIRIGTNQSGFSSGGQFLTVTDGAGGVAMIIGTNATTFYDPIAFSSTANAATTRTNLALGATNLVTFSNIQLGVFGTGSATGFAGRNSGGTFEISGTNVTSSVPAFYGWSGFENTAFSAGTARTNLELGATNAVTFSNITATGTLTANGDAVLNGVNNTMPSATNAASASSLMTRGLLPAATGNEPSFGPTFAYATSTTNSATAVVKSVLGFGVQVGSATNGRSCAAFGESFWTLASFSGGLMPANKAIDFYLHGTTFAFATNTNWVSRIIFGQGLSAAARIPPAAGSDAVTNRSWGVEFYYNGTNQVFRPFWHDGTNLAVAADQATFSTGNAFMSGVKLSQTGTGGISVTLTTSSSGRLSNSPTWSTNVASFNAGNYAGQGIFIEAAGNTNQAQGGSGTGILTRGQYIRYTP